jgi:hypothetical protein
VTYSVWNQGAGAFDYYEAPGVEAKANVPKPAHLRHRTLGSTPTQAAWPLPASARLVGSGDHARGRVASFSSGSALGGVGGDMGILFKVGLLGLSAILLWKYVK